ncbi:MAG: hypothetical protein ACTSX6_04765 [Candidatus Heimdallarchaeaceae archaeon]
MPELNYKSIGGILLLVVLLSSGATYYIQETNDYSNCRGLWEIQEDGMYKCSKTGESNYCYKIEYRGSGWYRCWIGKAVDVNQQKHSTNTGRYICIPDACYLVSN